MNEKALFVLKHMMGAAISRADRPLAGDDAQPWSELLERITRTINDKIAYAVRPLLMFILDKHENLTSKQKEELGKVSRRILEYGWSKTPYDSNLIISGLQGVCRTFESNPQESSALLSKTTEMDHLKNYGHIEMHWMARELKRVIDQGLASDLIRDIFIAVFTYNDLSQDQTPMGGRILPLVSSRKQDYEMARYSLAEVYPHFLRVSPVEAVEALIYAMAQYVEDQRESTRRFSDREIICANRINIADGFEIKGTRALILTDYSSIWDEGRVHRDYTQKLLDAFDEYLRSISMNEVTRELRHKVLDTIIQNNILACIWRRVLDCGKDFPQTLGLEVRDLAWSLAMLTCNDTGYNAGELIRAIFPLLESSERAKIENTIMSIPKHYGPDIKEAAERVRDKRLGCLDREYLTTESAKKRLEELDQSERGAPPNEPPFRSSGAFRSPIDELEDLREEGVNVDAPENKSLIELRNGIKNFCSKHHNSQPGMEKINEILPQLVQAYQKWQDQDYEQPDRRLQDGLFGHLVEACKQIATSEKITDESEAGQFIKKVLLKAANHPIPKPDPQFDHQFEDFPAWNFPSPRIDAAEGLMILAHNAPFVDQELLEAVDRLSADPVPAVRYMVAIRLLAFYKTKPDFMWNLITRFGEEENFGVINGFLIHTIDRLYRHHTDQAFPILRMLFEKARQNDVQKAGDARENCMVMFLSLHLWRKHKESSEIINNIINDPLLYHHEALTLPGKLKDIITVGLLTPSDNENYKGSQRAFEILTTLVEKTLAALKYIDIAHREIPFNDWPAEEQEKIKNLFQVLDAISNTVYFASGAFAEKEKERKGEETSLGLNYKNSYFNEADPVISRLAEAGHPAIIHHLVKTLEFLLEANPEKVLLRLGQIIRAGKSGGYQYESLAADLIVEIVERLLSEFRYILRETDECRRTLFEILDTFVEVGWPRARRLVYRLEDIYR